MRDATLACISHRPSAEMSLGAAGTSAQCRILFWIPLYPIHSQAFAAGPPGDSQGWQDRQTHANCKRAISVGGSVETKLVWNVLVAAEAKKYVALGTRACSAETRLAQVRHGRGRKSGKR